MRIKHNSFLTILVFLCISGLSSNSRAWDFPLDIDVIAIQFQGTGSSTTYDIRVNATTDSPKPEYSVGYSRNDKFACKINSAPTLWVNFYCNSAPDVSTSLTIDAIALAETTWNLADKEVMFNAGGGSIADTGNPTNFVTFETGDGTSVPGSVKSDNYVYWNWRVVAVGGVPISPYNITNTGHYFYTLLDTPLSPMSEPWTVILEKSCDWADGASSQSSVATGVVDGVYNHLVDQDGDIEYRLNNNYTSGDNTFWLTAFLDSLSLKSDVKVNCTDCANLFCIFSTSLGLSPTMKILEVPSQSDTLYTHSIDPIGESPYFSGWAPIM